MVKKDVEAVLDTIKKEKIRWIDLQFLDVPGYLQHIPLPAHAVDASSFADGIGKLDGSSIKGFKADGHDYIDQAIANGAVAIVTDRSMEKRKRGLSAQPQQSSEGARGTLLASALRWIWPPARLSNVLITQTSPTG